MHASGCSLIDLLIRELMHEETRYNNYGVRPHASVAPNLIEQRVHCLYPQRLVVWRTTRFLRRDGFVATFVTDPKTEEEKRLLPNR